MSEEAVLKAREAAEKFPLCEARGQAALKALATRFPQLYLAPVADVSQQNSVDGSGKARAFAPEEAAAAQAAIEAVDEAYRLAAGKGIAPKNASLAHFDSSPVDELRVVDTPAGPVQVLFLANRSAFEMFLQCVGHKAHAVPIPETIGAMTYCGINDWGRVQAARKAYKEAGGQQWPFDMTTLAKQRAFKAELIIISGGPYSSIQAALTPYDQDQWIQISREIRLHHECAHVVCRRTMPDVINPLWDEITADAVGLIKATGQYDTHLASLFLGVDPQGYSGGRLEEYLNAEQRSNIDEWAVKTYDAIQAIAQQTVASDMSDPFAYLLRLQGMQNALAPGLNLV